MQEQQQLHHGKQGFRGGNNKYRCGGKADEPKPTGEVVINAKPAGAIAPAARAEMF